MTDLRGSIPEAAWRLVSDAHKQKFLCPAMSAFGRCFRIDRKLTCPYGHSLDLKLYSAAEYDKLVDKERKEGTKYFSF